MEINIISQKIRFAIFYTAKKENTNERQTKTNLRKVLSVDDSYSITDFISSMRKPDSSKRENETNPSNQE